MVFFLGSITSYLTKQWDTFISNFGLFAAFGIFLYFVLQKTIEHGFQQKLESLKLDNQKVLKNFETLSSKQNERYPQLYFLAEQALGYISSLRGITSFPSFENAIEEEVVSYCEAIEMNSGDKNRILSLWERDKQKAVLEIQRIKRILDYNKAESKWIEANNYLIFNELYFSEDVTKNTRQLLDLMRKYWLNLNPDYNTPIFKEDLIEMRKENSGIKVEIEKQREIWKTTMKKAVSCVIQ